jgi:hypothetical protein
MFYAVALVFTFILRLRFPRNESIAQLILRRYDQATLQLFRNTERNDFKINKIESDIRFLNTCKHYEVFPKFVQFKVTSADFERTAGYRRCQEEILNHEVKNQEAKLQELKRRNARLLASLEANVSFIDFRCLKVRISLNTDKKLATVRRTHNKKLNDLGIRNDHKIDPNNVVFNFSNRVLSSREKELLGLGLDFSLPFPKLDFVNYFTNFESLCHSIVNIDTACGNLYRDYLPRIKNKISSLANNSFETIKREKVESPVVCKNDLSVLKLLKNDSSIVVTRPDKGRGTVVLNKLDYVEKMGNILSDRSKFIVLKEDCYKITRSLEEKLNRILRPLKDSLGNTVYNNIRACGSAIGTMYGLCKIHKAGNPLRPIVSSVNTFNYKLSKFLVPFLSILTNNQYTLRNTENFVTALKELRLSGPTVMASFDVVSLFTNVPLDETNKIAIDKMYSGDNNPPFDKSTFSKLLNIASSQSVFLFDSVLYKQIDGCSMGGPLSPTLANIFMCHYEDLWIENCPIHFKPLFYKRYVDDCFLIFKETEHVQLFLDYVNSQHHNIKFTCEVEENNSLSFLDCLVSKIDNKFITSVYRKPTYTGLGLNYFSFVPRIYKINSVKTLLNRAFNVSENYEIMHAEFMKIKTYFLNNLYPLHLIENCISNFLDKKVFPVEKIQSVPRLIKYVKLPFFGPQSYKIRKDLQQIFKQFNHVEFRIVFTNPFTIGSFFKIKDRIPNDVRSCVVYNYQCSGCNARYIGSTTRAFKARRMEHMGRSINTGRPITTPSFSSIRSHAETCNHPLLHSNFKILRSMPDAHTLLIAESIIIKQHKPSLNNHAQATELFTVQ